MGKVDSIARNHMRGSNLKSGYWQRWVVDQHIYRLKDPINNKGYRNKDWKFKINVLNITNNESGI